MSRPQDDRNQEATVYIGNLDERCTDALVWELMLQAGPVVNVHLPKDRISMTHQGYGFCEFLTEDDAEYACKIMNQIKLFGKPIRVNKASSDRKQHDIGANLFIGNLDPNVDERKLYETFSTFGVLVQTAKLSRDPTTGTSKGYGFISYDSFESADLAIESMNNQFLANKPISVDYAFKKEGKGERHGTPAERLLAAQARKNNALPSVGMGSLAPGAMSMGMGGGGGGGPPSMPPPPPPPQAPNPYQQQQPPQPPYNAQPYPSSSPYGMPPLPPGFQQHPGGPGPGPSPGGPGGHGHQHPGNPPPIHFSAPPPPPPMSMPMSMPGPQPPSGPSATQHSHYPSMPPPPPPPPPPQFLTGANASFAGVPTGPRAMQHGQPSPGPGQNGMPPPPPGFGGQ